MRLRVSAAGFSCLKTFCRKFTVLGIFSFMIATQTPRDIIFIDFEGGRQPKLTPVYTLDRTLAQRISCLFVQTFQLWFDQFTKHIKSFRSLKQTFHSAQPKGESDTVRGRLGHSVETKTSSVREKQGSLGGATESQIWKTIDNISNQLSNNERKFYEIRVRYRQVFDLHLRTTVIDRDIWGQHHYRDFEISFYSKLEPQKCPFLPRIKP